MPAGCEECSAYYRGRCPDHQVRLISDRPMQSRAWASLPTSYLSIRAVTADPDHHGETGADGHTLKHICLQMMQ